MVKRRNSTGLGHSSSSSAMHPRNPYRNPIDFARLAVKDAEFRNHCRLATNGKVLIDFTDDAAVRALTRSLLRVDFGLNVALPGGCLVPRIPQRLGYLLWLDDRLRDSGIQNRDVLGIDIGTGASCIYALLGAKLFNWRFAATETDTSAARIAVSNVEHNRLTERIQLCCMEESADTLIMDVVSGEYGHAEATFSMCNPPFFADDETEERFVTAVGGESWTNVWNREDEARKGTRQERCLAAVSEEPPNSLLRLARSPPRSATTAKSSELKTAGGEVAFISRLIDESCVLRKKVRLYTTMLGKKSSVSSLKRRLEQLLASEYGLRYSTDTLNQGRTPRWLLAWTFDEAIKLPGHCSRMSMNCGRSFSSAEEALNWCESLLREQRMNVERFSESDGPLPAIYLVCQASERCWVGGAKRRNARAEKRARQSSISVAVQTEEAELEESNRVEGKFGESEIEDDEELEQLDNSRRSIGVQATLLLQSKMITGKVKPTVGLLSFEVTASSDKNLELRLIDGESRHLQELLQWLKNSLHFKNH